MLRFHNLLFLFVICCFVNIADAKEPSYHETDWQQLMSPSWRASTFLEQFNLKDIVDGSDEADKLSKKMQEEWNKAPVNESMNGQRIKISGLIIPIMWLSEEQLQEFLVTPYMGSCIHSPPPPANQMIYVKLHKAVNGLKSMDRVTVYGELKTEYNDFKSLGVSGYSMQPDKVEPLPKQ